MGKSRATPCYDEEAPAGASDAMMAARAQARAAPAAISDAFFRPSGGVGGRSQIETAAAADFSSHPIGMVGGVLTAASPHPSLPLGLPIPWLPPSDGQELERADRGKKRKERLRVMGEERRKG